MGEVPRSRVGPRLRGAVGLVVVVAAFTATFPALYRQLGGASPFVAFIFTMAPMGLLRFAHAVHGFSVPRRVHRLRGWEFKAERQRQLGVLVWAWVLRHGPLRWLNTLVYLRRQRGAAGWVLRHVEAAEACHFWAFFAALPYGLHVVMQGWWGAAGVVCAVQVVGNVYPCLHLRYTRARLEALIARSAARTGRQDAA